MLERESPVPDPIAALPSDESCVLLVANEDGTRSNLCAKLARPFAMSSRGLRGLGVPASCLGGRSQSKGSPMGRKSWRGNWQETSSYLS